VNSNFDLETTKGNFVIRVLGKTLSLKIKKNLHLEFNVLKYLEKNKFSLKTPIPLKNNKNQIILKIGDKNI
jgi:Ser/Thr protein kinase RdoA (MazF antagonist)